MLSTVGDLSLKLLAAATGAHSRCVHGVLVDMYFLSRDWCLVVNGVSRQSRLAILLDVPIMRHTIVKMVDPLANRRNKVKVGQE